jgi:hypothetical protein
MGKMGSYWPKGSDGVIRLCLLITNMTNLTFLTIVTFPSFAGRKVKVVKYYKYLIVELWKRGCFFV